ncbi:DNA binding protein, partial [Phytophthora megakarya]
QSEHGVQIYGNSAGWWNAQLSIAFLDYHFASRTDDEPVLLIWDEFSAHWTDEVQEHAVLLNVHLVKVPARLTSVCQPADISWLRPLKQRLRKHWVIFLSQQLKYHAASSSTAHFQLRPPSRGEAIAWATSAWKQLSISVITSGFSGETKTYRPDDHENDIIEQLESLHVVEDTVSDSDDFVEHLIAGTSDEQ